MASRFALAAVLALGGCLAEPPGELPGIVLVGDATEADWIAAATWSDIGFRVGAVGAECAARWYEPGPVADCTITIDVRREALLRERAGTNALADRNTRTIYVDDRLEGIAACHAIAHEVGHVILDTGDHTIGGVMGGASCTVLEIDRLLACATIGACE